MDGQLTFDDPDFSAERKPRMRVRAAARGGDQLRLAAGDKSLVLDDEGLFSRLVHTHSTRKSYFVRRYCEIVGTAMRPHWPQMWWVELFAGPGRLLEHETGSFLAGSPVEAVNVKHPWSGYVFSDLSEMCVAALRARTAGRSDVHVLQGDANSAALLDEIAGTVPRHALVCLYADPEGLDLHLGTIRFFAERYQHLDLLLNVPVAGVVRYLAAGGESKAVPVLGHSDPAALLREGKGRHFGPDVRVWYQRQLAGMGYQHFRTESIVLAEKNVPIYDLLLASRHERAAALFEKACEIRPDGQRSLFAP